MATISFSPALVASITDRLTKIAPTATSIDYTTYLFTTTYSPTQYNSTPTYGTANATVYFKNSSGTALAAVGMSGLTRTQDVNGYVAFTNFPVTTPSVAGTIDYIEIANTVLTTYYQSFSSNTQSIQNTYNIILTVGDTGSGADVEIANRDLVTNQPWRLDGSIRFRVPNSYTYST